VSSLGMLDERETEREDLLGVCVCSFYILSFDTALVQY
jgi:hypothetical protein